MISGDHDLPSRRSQLPRSEPISLAVRVTALSIAGDGGREVKALAESLTKNSETPVILKKVAERVSR